MGGWSLFSPRSWLPLLLPFSSQFSLRLPRPCLRRCAAWSASRCRSWSPLVCDCFAPARDWLRSLLLAAAAPDLLL